MRDDAHTTAHTTARRDDRAAARCAPTAARTPAALVPLGACPRRASGMTMRDDAHTTARRDGATRRPRGGAMRSDCRSHTCRSRAAWCVLATCKRRDDDATRDAHTRGGWTRRERTYAPARHLRARRVARHMSRRRAQQLGDGRARRRRRRSSAAVRLHGRRRRVAGALLRPAPGPRRKWRRPFRLGAVDRSAQHLDVDLTRQLAALHRAERTCEGRRGRWTHTDHHDRRSLATRCDPSFFLSLSPSPHAPRIAPRGR